MSNRRKLLVALGLGALSAAIPAPAQQKNRVWRIGTVFGQTTLIAKPYAEAFLAGMKDHGYVVGRNLIFDSRFAEGNPQRYAALIDEVIALNPDVLIGGNTGSAIVMKSKTTTIPIVLATSGDPVGDGLAQSLARPGGNITGVSLQLSELGAKHVELIGELLPQMRHVALLVDASATTPQNKKYEQLTYQAAAAKGLSIQTYRFESQGEIDEKFRLLKAKRPDALVIGLSPRLNNFRQEISQRAANIRLPSIAFIEGYAQDGGLMSYGPSFVEAWRRVAYFVDRILKGANPGDLPIEQPTKFELVLNLKTAKALGLTIPQAILVRTDKVIE